MRVKRMHRLVAVGALMALVAACGGGTTADPTTTSVAGATTTTVAATTTTAASATTTAATSTETTEATAGSGTGLTIEAVDSEGFSVGRLEAPAGEITVTFANNDTSSGEPHNWHVTTPEGDYLTPIVLGPSTDSVTFTVGTPGEYVYMCDTHLAAMQGTLVVTP